MRVMVCAAVSLLAVESCAAPAAPPAPASYRINWLRAHLRPGSD